MADAWSQSDIDKLRAAIASGVRRIRYDGPPAREAEYHSLQEMRDLLAEMTNTVSKPPAFRLAKFNKVSR